MDSSFPTLLKKRAKILGGFNRGDLFVLGGGYLLLSIFRISGIKGLILNALVLISFKYLSRKIPAGFFKGLRSPKIIKWGYIMEEIDE